MPKIESKSFLSTWLNGFETLETLLNGARLTPDLEFGAWIALEEVYFAHNALGIKSQSLPQSWLNTEAYVQNALKLVVHEEDERPELLRIEHEDRADIICELGKPPLPCLPLYIFSVDDGKNEVPVYIGKTNSQSGRFSGGHKACVKLLDPKYSNCVKRIYMCQVVFLSEVGGEYLPLEWVRPHEKAAALLDHAESFLIHRFQPEFNVYKKQKKTSKLEIDYVVVNYSDRDSFLED